MIGLLVQTLSGRLRLAIHPHPEGTPAKSTNVAPRGRQPQDTIALRREALIFHATISVWILQAEALNPSMERLLIPAAAALTTRIPAFASSDRSSPCSYKVCTWSARLTATSRIVRPNAVRRLNPTGVSPCPSRQKSPCYPSTFTMSQRKTRRGLVAQGRPVG